MLLSGEGCGLWRWTAVSGPLLQRNGSEDLFILIVLCWAEAGVLLRCGMWTEDRALTMAMMLR